MKRLLSLFIVLVVLTGAKLCAPPEPVDAQMLVGVYNTTTPTISFVQACSGTTTTCSLTSVVVGDALIGCVAGTGTSAPGLTGVSDGTSSFTLGTPVAFTSVQDIYARCFYLLSANSGSKTYTLTWSTAPNTFYFMWVAEFNATSGSWHYDTAPSGGGSYNASSASSTSTNFTTSSAGGEAIVCSNFLNGTAASVTVPEFGTYTPTEFSFSPISTYNHQYYLLNHPITGAACTLTYSTATTWTNLVIALNAH